MELRRKDLNIAFFFALPLAFLNLICYCFWDSLPMELRPIGYVAQASLQILIILPLPQYCWTYRHVPSCPVVSILLFALDWIPESRLFSSTRCSPTVCHTWPVWGDTKFYKWKLLVVLRSTAWDQVGKEKSIALSQDHCDVLNCRQDWPETCLYSQSWPGRLQGWQFSCSESEAWTIKIDGGGEGI